MSIVFVIYIVVKDLFTIIYNYISYFLCTFSIFFQIFKLIFIKQHAILKLYQIFFFVYIAQI